MLQLPGLLPTPPHLDEYRRIAYGLIDTCARKKGGESRRFQGLSEDIFDVSLNEYVSEWEV